MKMPNNIFLLLLPLLLLPCLCLQLQLSPTCCGAGCLHAQFQFDSGTCLLQAGVPDMSLVVNAKLEYALECSGFNVRSFIGAAAPDLAVNESDPVLQDLLQVGPMPSCTAGGGAGGHSHQGNVPSTNSRCLAVGSQAPARPCPTLSSEARMQAAPA